MPARPLLPQVFFWLSVLLGFGGLGGTVYFGYQWVSIRLSAPKEEVGGLIGLLGAMGEGALKGYLVLSIIALALGAALYLLTRRR